MRQIVVAHIGRVISHYAHLFKNAVYFREMDSDSTRLKDWDVGKR
jgi:hypothetical protein